MKYTLSINIEHSTFDPESYIVTPNALGVVGRIIDAYSIQGFTHLILLALMEQVNLVFFWP